VEESAGTPYGPVAGAGRRLADGPPTELAATIARQGEVLRGVLDLDLGAALEELEGAPRVWLVGTGTSEHAAQLGAMALATAGIDARPASSAAFCARAGELRAGDAVIVISHTTETAFARTGRGLARAAGARLLSITATGKGWPEALEVAPPERSETYTASYLAALLALARLAVELGSSELTEADLVAVPDLVDRAAGAEIAQFDRPPRLTVVFGAGPNAVTAREGALKLREAARVPAEGFESEYLLHGSAQLLGPHDLILAIDPAGDDSGLSPALMRAGSAAGCTIGAFVAPDGIHPLLAQLPMTVGLQALAAAWADARGTDPDRIVVSPWDAGALWNAGGPEG
jgi:glucosamine--fructose-6-phosphate aminotransferase (isomerizing)